MKSRDSTAMPLITKLFPKLERAQQTENGAGSLKKLQGPEGEEQYSIIDEYDYSDFEEGDENDVDMDGNSILHRPRPKKTVPDLPVKSRMRASRILEDLTIQLQSLEQSALNDINKHSDEDPHEHYLSSEEEASESADDYDESIIELDSDRPTSSRASSRHSHEDVARVVSFMFVGKPMLVEITLEKPKATAHLQRFSNKRPSPLRLTPSTSMTSLRSNRPTTSRTSSLGAPTNVMSGSSTSFIKPKISVSTLAGKASFLSYDPYPAAEAKEMSFPSPSKNDSSSEKHSKDTTSSTKDSWKLNRRFSISSKHRKPSISNLSHLNTMSTVTLPVQSSLNLIATHTSRNDADTKRGSSGSFTYEDIMRSISRAPSSPETAKSPRMGRFTRTKVWKA